MKKLRNRLVVGSFPDLVRLRLSCLALFPLVGLGLVGVSWLIAYLMLHPPTQSTGASPADAPALPYREISFKTSDGLILRGWYLPGRSNATVILVHGYARDRSELLPEARWLVERGYSALLFDSRAHISLGYLEALDVRAAVDYILNQSPTQRVGVMGYSMGAVAAIHAAAGDERIRAVIAVSPFASLREVVDLRLKRIRPLVPLIVWWSQRMTALHPGDLRPVDRVAAIAPRPILIMQAGDDGFVPLESGERLYDAAGDPKELWSVPGVAHVDFRQAMPKAYRQKVIGFFEKHLPCDEKDQKSSRYGKIGPW